MLPYISIYFMDKDCIYPFISFKIPWVLSLPLSTLELHVPCLRAVESTWRAGCLSSQRVYHFEDFSFNKKNKQRIYNLIELSSDIQIKNSMCVYIYIYIFRDSFLFFWGVKALPLESKSKWSPRCWFMQARKAALPPTSAAMLVKIWGEAVVDGFLLQIT